MDKGNASLFSKFGIRRYPDFLHLLSLIPLVQRHVCTAHNTHAALRHAATSPNIYNDVILPTV